MTFKIIKNSEGCKKWDIRDEEYEGQVSGLCCGWEFEVEREGVLDSHSVIWFEGTPEQCVKAYYLDEPDCYWRLKGWELTGRVVFRGYGRSYYDPEEREWFVEEVKDYELDEILNTPEPWEIEDMEAMWISLEK